MENGNPKSKIKNILLTVLGAILSISFIATLTTGSFPWHTKQQSAASADMAMSKELMEVVNEYNKLAPFMIDSNTRFDNMTLMPGNEIRYSFTAISATKDDIDVEDFEKTLTKTTTNQIKTNPQMETFRKLRATISYSYKDMNGNFICTIKITPDMYK